MISLIHEYYLNGCCYLCVLIYLPVSAGHDYINIIMRFNFMPIMMYIMRHCLYGLIHLLMILKLDVNANLRYDDTS